MKQLISDWVLAIEPEQSGQSTIPCLAFGGLSAYAKFLSDESKVLLLAHLYLELCLNAEQALRAARADVMTAGRWNYSPNPPSMGRAAPVTNAASGEQR
jgi:hypothetical protein